MKTILVVDDNAMLRRLAVALLERGDFRVLSAACGAEALALAATEAGIDLLLSDLSMPEMNGDALAETLRRTHPEVHVILMSGEGEEGNLPILSDGWGFIPKPFNPSDLVQTVRDVLDSRSASQKTQSLPQQGRHGFGSDTRN
jgi:CheY-like chemotaxis protein